MRSIPDRDGFGDSQRAIRSLPYRGAFGDPRPAPLTALALPPQPMPSRLGGRPLKAWRYVGVYGPELMLCLASVRVGPFRQSFWAAWDRSAGRLYERTAMGGGAVRLGYGSAAVSDRGLGLDLAFTEAAGVETICTSGEGYAWTRKQGGVIAGGTIALGGEAPRAFAGRAVIDDTAAYYERHTRWRWSAGVGTADDGRQVAWNLVDGVNDPAHDSERTVWLDGVPGEVGPVRFAEDLSTVGDLSFSDDSSIAGDLSFREEAVRERNENRLLIRSRYRQPFGTFSGSLPGGIALAEGWGVMEDHDVWW
jgi:hypothetical protein